MKKNVEKENRKEMELLNLRDTAAYLGISKRTARRLIDQRAVAFFKVGGSIRIDKTDLDDYLMGRRTEKITY